MAAIDVCAYHVGNERVELWAPGCSRRSLYSAAPGSSWHRNSSVLGKPELAFG